MISSTAIAPCPKGGRTPSGSASAPSRQRADKPICATRRQVSLRTRGAGPANTPQLGRVFLGVGVPLQFSIALFTGMVAATFVPPVRRSIPRVVEVCLWIAFLTVCLLGVMSITDPGARELSTSAAWAAEQLINSMAGLALGGIVAWISNSRFAIANWLAIIAGADILALMLMRSLRQARPWQPRVRLLEWMELPMPAASAPARAQTAADPIAELNRKTAAAVARAGAASTAPIVIASRWLQHELLQREAPRLADMSEAGRSRSQAYAESVQDAANHLGYAARAWYAAAGEPAISGLAARLRPARLKLGQVVDIQALLSAQSTGRYGSMAAGPTPRPGDQDAPEQQSDRLAS
jgi:hypothetical protein